MFLQPDYILNSIYDIDIMELKSVNIKGLFFDLDSTLMKSKSGKFSFRTLQFLNDLRTNFKLAIISNNHNTNYIKQAQSQTDIPIYANAKKPDTKVILKACRDLGLDPTTVAMVGDRPLTDIVAGKNAKMCTILVDSISKEEEWKIVRLVRYIERLTVKRVS